MLKAMRGCSCMKGGKGKTTMKQHDSLFVLYCVKQLHRLSQRDMLEGGRFVIVNFMSATRGRQHRRRIMREASPNFL